MTCFAEELIDIYTKKREEILSNKEKEDNVSRRANDIILFFEKEIKECAKDKMMSRAKAGRPTANILEYSWNERFYVDESNNVTRYTNGDVNFPNYRINDVVLRDNVFKKLLKNFENEISSISTKVKISCWRPNTTIYVIEAIWGSNKHHDSTKNGYVSLPKVSRDYQKRWTYMECL